MLLRRAQLGWCVVLGLVKRVQREYLLCTLSRVTPRRQKVQVVRECVQQKARRTAPQLVWRLAVMQTLRPLLMRRQESPCGAASFSS